MALKLHNAIDSGSVLCGESRESAQKQQEYWHIVGFVVAKAHGKRGVFFSDFLVLG